MKPRTISASSLLVADACLARYKAENIDFAPGTGDKTAANIGTACHGALEEFVRRVYIDKIESDTLQLLLACYDVAYMKTFDTVEARGKNYDDGKGLLQDWYARTSFEGVTVLSVETKKRFPIPTSAGNIPMTYIIDRVDLIEVDGKKILRVVDYKSIRAFVSHEDLREKLQARIYDLMMRIEYKDAGIDEYQVVFDMLRHDMTVGVVFSREEAEYTYRSVIARAERILAADPENPPETLNAECGYCVRKISCKTLQANVAAGGMLSVVDINSAAALRYELDAKAKGLAAALTELDQFILTYAEHNETTNFMADNLNVVVSSRKTRTVNNSAAASILGPELMKRFGKLNLTDIDTIVKSGLVDESQAQQLNEAIENKFSNPSIKITKK